MRVTSRHLHALDRQVMKSVNIERASKNSEECLNLKSEWARSMIPGLKVSKSKGSIDNKEDLKGFDLSESSLGGDLREWST